MTKTAVFLVFALIGVIVFSSCEKDQIEANESYVQNYSGKKIKEFKVKLCVQKGNGDWHSIEVSKSSEDTHLAKGAMYPNNCMEPGKKMNEDCKIIKVSEIANNKIDDDCDGFVDCDDPDVAKADACNTGCQFDILLANRFHYKNVYTPMVPEELESRLQAEQQWAIKYCESYQEGDLQDWRLGSMKDYTAIKDACGIHVREDRDQVFWPSMPLITIDQVQREIMEVTSYYRGDGDDLIVPDFYPIWKPVQFSLNYMIVCVQDK